MYLTLDGGGTKLVAALFDEHFQVIARGRSGGVNTTQNRMEDIVAHVDECLNQVLTNPVPLEHIYAIFVGPIQVLKDAFQKRGYETELTVFTEGQAGLLAGAGQTEGMLAISGTGSDVFYFKNNERTMVGGYGPVLGDQGSGTWISLQAVQAAVKEINGWGEHTLLTEKIRKYFHAEEDAWEIVRVVHHTMAPFPVISKLTPIVAEAANEGDAVALSIFKEAGIQMGLQIQSLVKKLKDPFDHRVILCGGAWKAHPVMVESFQQSLGDSFQVCRPWFEHLVAGPMFLALSKGMTPVEAREMLNHSFESEILSREA